MHSILQFSTRHEFMQFLKRKVINSFIRDFFLDVANLLFASVLGF